MDKFPVLTKRTANGSIQEWGVEVVENKDGTATIVKTQGLRGGAKQVYREDITEGKNIGKSNETSAIEQAYKEAEAEWTKKQARGQYGLDANAIESGEKRAAAPMLAQKYQDHCKKINWDNAYVQPKLDGNRGIAKADEKGKITLWTRKGVQITTLPHIVKALEWFLKPNEAWDGELYIHGEHVTNLRSFLTREQEGCRNVSYRIYDTLSPAPFQDRLHSLYDQGLSTTKPVDGLMLVPTIKVYSEKELMAYQRGYIEDGYEGAMLRWGDAGYEAGKRSDSLLKVKTFEDGEFIIVGVNKGKGTYKDMAVFECKTAEGFTFSVTAPGTHEEKKAAWKNRESFIGCNLTVKHAGWTRTDQPVPFQPVAVAVRPRGLD